eukprot:4916866-Amphidinium_carterae.3
MAVPEPVVRVTNQLDLGRKPMFVHMVPLRRATTQGVRDSMAPCGVFATPTNRCTFAARSLQSQQQNMQPSGGTDDGKDDGSNPSTSSSGPHYKTSVVLTYHGFFAPFYEGRAGDALLAMVSIDITEHTTAYSLAAIT